MSFTLTPQTTLDAVNQMLFSLGQSPVETITGTGIKDVAIATMILQNTTRAVLLDGWTFNTDYEFAITPNINDRILVPADCLSIDTSYAADGDWVQRYDTTHTAMSMYDLINQTFDRTTTLYCDIVRFYDFEQIPQAARNYIAIRAARIFQAGAVASDVLFRFEQVDEMDALTSLRRAENRVGDRNILQGPDSTNQIWQRRRNPRPF